MKVAVAVPIHAPRARVWDIVVDIEHAGKTVKAIEKVEVLERPDSGLVGFKWRETRTMFGKEATEVMWITRAEPQRWYETRAESHGMVYTTRVEVDDTSEGGTRLSMEFGGEPRTFGAKVMGVLFATVMRGSIRKSLLKDLEDIKAAAESRN